MPRNTDYLTSTRHADVSRRHHQLAAEAKALYGRVNEQMIKNLGSEQNDQLPDITASQVTETYGRAMYHEQLLGESKNTHGLIGFALSHAQELAESQKEANDHLKERHGQLIREVQRIREGAGNYLISTKKHASHQEPWVLIEDANSFREIIRPNQTLTLKKLQKIMGSGREQYFTNEVWERTVSLHEAVEKVTAEKDQLSNSHRELGEVYVEAQKSKRESEEEAKSAKDQVNAVHSAHGDTKKEVARLKALLAEYTSPIDFGSILDAERQRLSKIHEEALQSLREDHRQQLENLTDAKNALSDDNRALKEQKAEIEDKLNSTESLLSEQQSQAESLRSQISSLQTMVSTGDAEKNTRIDNLQKSLGELEIYKRHYPNAKKRMRLDNHTVDDLLELLDIETPEGSLVKADQAPEDVKNVLAPLLELYTSKQNWHASLSSSSRKPICAFLKLKHESQREGGDCGCALELRVHILLARDTKLVQPYAKRDPCARWNERRYWVKE